MTTQTEAQRLANELQDEAQDNPDDYRWKAAAELLRLEADFGQLMQKHNALHINARAGRDRIAELEAEVQALRGAADREQSSKGMLIARLENGPTEMTVDTVLALISDCDYLASLEAPQSAQGEKQ